MRGPFPTLMQRGRLFLFWTKKNIYTKMFYLYLQSSSASRQPKISNLMFLANPVYRVRSHPSDTAGHGPQLVHISLWNIPIFRWRIFYLHLQSASTSRKWKNANVIRFADLVHRVRRDPSVTLRKFSPDTTGHGLRITKRPAVWHFSIFLFEKYQFLLENILSLFRMLKRF